MCSIFPVFLLSPRCSMFLFVCFQRSGTITQRCSDYKRHIQALRDAIFEGTGYSMKLIFLNDVLRWVKKKCLYPRPFCPSYSIMDWLMVMYVTFGNKMVTHKDQNIIIASPWVILRLGVNRQVINLVGKAVFQCRLPSPIKFGSVLICSPHLSSRVMVAVWATQSR